MVREIKPVSGSWRGQTYTDPTTQIRVSQPIRDVAAKPQRSLLSPSYDWLRSQEFDFDRYLIGTSPYRPGTIRGGLSSSQLQSYADAEQFATIPDPPRLDVSILAGQQRPRVGQLTLDLIDPFATIGQLTGSYAGLEQPVIGPGGTTFDPGAFLASKQIDLFGMDPDTAGPGRISDYALAPLIAAAEMIRGAEMPKLPVQDMPYAFQQDRAYWTRIADATDDDLQRLAWTVVERQADAATNQWLVDQLYEQFKIDRNKTAFLSSGDAGLDYMTIKAAAATDFQPSGDAGWTAMMSQDLAKATLRLVPFVGWNMAEGLDPITPEERAAWASLTPKDRAERFGFMGWSKASADLAGSLPLLSAGGTVAAVAKGAGGTAGAAYKTYSGLMAASKATMALGVTSATATWALQAYWPEDVNLGPITGEGVQEFTKRVDLARPFSQSDFAGAINAIGFWSSGTWGVGTAASVTRRAAPRVMGGVGKALDAANLPHPSLGMPDLRFYSYGMGGTPMQRFAVESLGLSEQGIRVSAQRLLLSETLNQVRRTRFARWAAALAGQPTGTMLDDIDDMALKVELAGQDMARPLTEATAEAEARLRVLHAARMEETLTEVVNGRRRLGSILSDDVNRMRKALQRNARALDDRLAQGFVSEYGAQFFTRWAGANTPEAVRAAIAKSLDLLGGNVDSLPAANKRSLEWWHQLGRMVYHYDFDRWAGLIHDASEGAEEAARLSVMSQRHVFRDEADELIPLLRGDDAAAKAAAMDKLARKIEVEDWALANTADAARRSRYGPGGITGPWSATPEALADHLEDIRDTLAVRRTLPDPAKTTAGEPLNLHHRAMEEQGTWTIGYKPVDEAGEFVASVETRTGQAVQTRWLDYPLSNADNIELGNAGSIRAKLDAVTRGARTWRLIEYQRSSLFRALSSKTDYTPTQIQAFHDGVMSLSRRHAISPQAVGRAPTNAPGLRVIEEEVATLARQVFGAGQHVDKNGKPINWRREIGSAYRQAYSLNLTAGLTSHIKASFGPLGEWVTYGSDFIYVMWRFGLSPLFKAGELWESAQLNLMRRVAPKDDPWTTMLYVRQGAGQDPGVIATEITGDQMAAGLVMANERGLGVELITPAGGEAVRSAWASERRAASSLSWHARRLPEDYELAMARRAMQGQAAEFRAQALGGEAIRTTDRGRMFAELANSVDETGKLLPGVDETRVKTLLRQLNREDLDPDVADALDAYPWGAPTAAQLAERDDLLATAENLRAGNIVDAEDATGILVIYRDLIKRGMVEPDRALALYDRLDELVRDLTDERARAKAWKGGAGTLNLNTTAKAINLQDPITGKPVMRDTLYATDREFDTALRSLRSRRAAARKRITVPSVDDLAHRLEVAAETVVAPRPIFRSERVGPEDGIPEGYTLDPAEVLVSGEIGGRASWVDAENTTPDQRGMWHATTKTTAVLDTGLKSRAELINELVPTEVREAIRTSGYTHPDQVKFVLDDGSWSYFRSAVELQEFIDGQLGMIPSTGWSADPFNMVRKIVLDDGSTPDGRLLWEWDGVPRHAPEGLSATQPDEFVSVTTDWTHAETIASTMKLMGLVANGRAGGSEIIDHFWPLYDNLIGDEETILDAILKAAGNRSKARTAAGGPRSTFVPGDVDASVRNLEQWIDDLPVDERAYLVAGLDIGLNDAKITYTPDYEGFHGYVGFAGSPEGWRNIDPEEVGVVRVAAKSNFVPPLDEPTLRVALDEAFQLRTRQGPVSDRDVIIVELSDGSTSRFLRWANTPPNVDNATGMRRSPMPLDEWKAKEADAFAQWADDLLSQPFDGSSVPVSVAVWDARALGRIEIAGTAGPRGSRDMARRGPDQFEIQLPSKDAYVVDPRHEAEPIADNDDDLLRQLRMTIDENGETIPGLDRRRVAIEDRLEELRQEALNPDPVNAMDEIPETAAGITANLEDAVRARIGNRIPNLDNLWDPVPWKTDQQTRLVIQMQREEFPRVIADTPAARVFREVAGPEAGWADWLVRDRDLLDRWTRAKATGTPEEAAAALDELVAHAGGDDLRGLMDDLYGSEEWDTIASLWSLNLEGASQEAFGVHFFDQYRSPLLRSINHPVLGVYPASWAIKTAREWMKFLFDNRMFGADFRLGMTPAVVIANMVRSQNTAFAMTNPGEGDLETYLEEGPLGSTIFVFNLLMPGDWSAIPFPLSRSVREVLRGNYDPGYILAQNANYMGVTRDVRLATEMVGEARNLVFGPPEDEQPDTGWLPAEPLVVGGIPVAPPVRSRSWDDDPNR